MPSLKEIESEWGKVVCCFYLGSTQGFTRELPSIPIFVQLFALSQGIVWMNGSTKLIVMPHSNIIAIHNKEGEGLRMRHYDAPLRHFKDTTIIDVPVVLENNGASVEDLGRWLQE